MKKIIISFLSAIMVMTMVFSVQAAEPDYEYYILDCSDSVDDRNIKADTSVEKDVMTSIGENVYNITSARYIEGGGNAGNEYATSLKFGEGHIWDFIPDKQGSYSIYAKVYFPTTQLTTATGLSAGLMTDAQMDSYWKRGSSVTPSYKKIVTATNTGRIYIASTHDATKSFQWLKLLISQTDMSASGNATDAKDFVQLSSGEKYYIGFNTCKDSNSNGGAYIDKILVVEADKCVDVTAAAALADDASYTSVAGSLTLKADEDALSFPATYTSANVESDNPFASIFTSNAITELDATQNKLNITISSIKEKAATVIVAGYDDSKEMVGCDVIPYNLHLGYNQITYNPSKLEDAAVYKTFLWNGMTPVTEAYPN